jgi:hypothetical protein
MPTVGNKKYDYSPTGVARANRASKISNKPVQMNTNRNPNRNPNRNAVNDFMNRSTIEDRTRQNTIDPNPQDVTRLQTGLNFLNKNSRDYTPLRIDGVMGPKTNATASRYLGAPSGGDQQTQSWFWD